MPFGVNLVSDARKLQEPTSVTINEPALEPSKNRFDERITNKDAREGLTPFMMRLLPVGCKLSLRFG